MRLYNGVRLLGGGPCLANVRKIDHGAIPMTLHMMQRGLQVDLDHFKQMEEVLTEDMERLTAEVEKLAGHPINLGSGDQVSHFLFKELGIKQARVKFTKSGDRESVEDDVLTAIQHLHPVVSKLQNYKEYEKLRGTYAIPIQRLARKAGQGWRLFPNLKTTRVPSGRFSCDEPNLLAMPNRTKRGRELLLGFITSPGWTYLSVDESQIEPRTLAHRSQDPRLMAIYFNKEDLYSDFAIAAFKLPNKRYHGPCSDGCGCVHPTLEGEWHYPGVDKKTHRFPAKTCTLAAIYRVTHKGLVEQMPVICKHCHSDAAEHLDTCRGFEPQWNENNCQDIINAFYKRYAGIAPMQRVDDGRAMKKGMVWDDFGRMLHVAATQSVHEYVVAKALREAGNMPIQGFACGTLKLTMAAVQDDLEMSGMLGDVVHPLLPIHDEILLECRADVAEELGEHICHRFRTCVKLTVPIEAEWAQAERWGEISK